MQLQNHLTIILLLQWSPLCGIVVRITAFHTTGMGFKPQIKSSKPWIRSNLNNLLSSFQLCETYISMEIFVTCPRKIPWWNVEHLHISLNRVYFVKTLKLLYCLIHICVNLRNNLYCVLTMAVPIFLCSQNSGWEALV